ncbi:MAG: nucleotide exchange factor GrpE [Anaerolineales bacterium]
MSRKRTHKTENTVSAEMENEIPPEGAASPEETAPSQGQAAAQEILETEPLTGDSISSEMAALQEQLNAAQAQAQEYLDGWQRARAEFANYKRRIERDRELMQQDATARIAARYLPIVDDIERALQNRPQSGDGAAWADGIELIYRKLLAALAADNVYPLDAEGQMFDPNYHEAILQEESDVHESGQIITVLQKGYRIGERVLRPALVKVAT